MKSTSIVKDPEIMGGTPVFKGTRVPVRAFIDSLECGDSLDDFLENYPGVSRKQAVEVLELAMERLTDDKVVA